MPKKPPEKVVATRLSVATHERLFREAQEQGTTISAIIRGTLEHQVSLADLAAQIREFREEQAGLQRRANALTTRSVITIEELARILVGPEKFKQLTAAVDTALNPKPKKEG